MDSPSDKLREIIDGAFVSSYSAVGLQSLRYLLAVIVVSIIGSSGYGVLATVRRISGSLIILFSGIFTGMKRTIPRKGEKNGNMVVVTSLLMVIIISIFVSILTVYKKGFILEEVLTGYDDSKLVYGAIFLFLANTIAIFSGEILKSYKNIGKYNLVIKWASPILQIFIIVVASIFFPDTLKTVIYSICVALILAFSFGVILILKYTEHNPINIVLDVEVIGEYSRYVAVASFGTLFSGIQSTVPNIMMTQITAEQAGVFGIGLIIATLSRIPLGSINQIFPQVATDLHERDQSSSLSDLYKRTSKLAIFFTSPLAFLFMTWHNEIAVFVSPNYAPYSAIIPVMITGQVFAVVIGTVGFLIMMTDNHEKIVPIQFILMVFTVLTTYYLTIWYGVLGLALAYSISFTLNNIIELIFLYREEGLFSITWDHIIILVMLAVFSLFYYYIVKPVLPSVGVDMALCTGFTIILVAVNYKIALDSPERHVIKNKISDTLGFN